MKSQHKEALSSAIGYGFFLNMAIKPLADSLLNKRSVRLCELRLESRPMPSLACQSIFKIRTPSTGNVDTSANMLRNSA